MSVTTVLAEYDGTTGALLVQYVSLGHRQFANLFLVTFPAIFSILDNFPEWYYVDTEL